MAMKMLFLTAGLLLVFALSCFSQQEDANLTIVDKLSDVYMQVKGDAEKLMYATFSDAIPTVRPRGYMPMPVIVPDRNINYALIIKQVPPALKPNLYFPEETR
jgi:hypothetical protein